MMDDKKACERFAGMNIEDGLAAAKEMGLDFTVEELKEAGDNWELTPEQLEMVSGGGVLEDSLKGAAKGAGAGALVGTLIGSIGGPPGAAIGCMVGGGVGALFGGVWTCYNSDEKD